MNAKSIQVKDVAVRKPRVPKVQPQAIDPKDAFLLEVLKQGASLDQMQRLIDMRNAEQERQSKLAHDEHFAEMQAEFKPVQRTKKGDKGNYAPLDALQKEYGPIIAKHGFSYKWSEEELEGGKLKVTLTISGWGHTTSNYKILPAYEPDKGSQSGKPIMNVLQAEGTRSTYGQRYTFIAGFGLIIEDMDTDGNLTFEDGVKYAAEIALIRGASDMDELAAQFKLLYQKLDNEGRQIISREKDKRKKELSK